MKKITLALAALFVMVGMSRADNWMKHLPDGEYVANVSIPGTHDAATGHGFTSDNLYKYYAQTQDLTMDEQWTLGVRAFDLRPVTTDNGNLRISHGMANTNLLFTEAMLMLRDSLIANPSEFVVLHILHESEYDSSSYDYETLLHAFLNSDDMKDYIVDFRQNLTVADMRGKILMLYRDSYSTKPVGGLMSGWCGYINWSAQTQGKITAGKGSGSYTTSPLYMQDFSDTSEEGGVDIKVGGVETMLDYTTTHYYTSASSIVWVFNFASGYSRIDNLIGSSLSNGYRDNASYTNKAIADYLAKKSGPTGIILADYVGVNSSTGKDSFIGSSKTYETMGMTLVESILANNWEYIDYLDGGEEALEATVKKAEALDVSTNVGTGVFEVPQSYATAVTNAISEGKALLDGNYHSETAYYEAVDAINEAVEAFNSAILNEPAEGELFNITLSASGNSCDGYAVTFVEDAGSYELLFTKDIAPVYGQAFTFTHQATTDKPNGYTISFTDVDGKTRYLCNSSGQGISTTTTASSAFVYEVVITSQENVWNLYNSETNSYVGCTDGTLANSASASTLVFSDTEAMSVDIELSDDWGTLILPFTANVPNGLTVYSCSGAEKGVLSLTEETTIVANTPYILNGKGTYTFTGTGTYYSGYSLTAGLLTGTILGTTVSEGAYVLDTQDGVQAFYAVASSTSLAAYTCYLSGDELTEDVYGFTGYDTAALEAAIENAESKDITTNVGTGVFEVPQSYATAVTEAIAAGKALLENDILTEEECQKAIDAINEAVEAFNSATLNEPAEGELFNITLSASGNSCDGYAVTFVEDAGSYELLFTKDIDPVYGQAFTFTPSEEKANGYVISFTDVDGETRYLCNGSGQSISTTTTASSAFVYEVVITSQENVWNLYNSETNSYVGCTDGTLASSASASTLVFSDTEAMSVDIELSDDWGTLILPLAASVPEGMTVYSCTATDEDEGEVVLTAEAAIVANTPYIVNGKGTYTFEGTGAYYSGYSLTAGLLTGTILGSTVPEGAYVLADQGEGQAFYIVTEADTSLLPYSCYFTVETSDEGAESRTFYNLPGGTVAVKAVEADVEGNASKALYDMHGRQVTTPRRGIYIRGGEKVLVK